MKRFITLIVVIAVAFGTVALAVAQQAGPPHGGMQRPPAATDAPGAHGHDAHHAHHMEMCRQMMGAGMGQGMMGPGMMGGGMMGMMSGDPKQQAEMMAMRGEMMKAMGDIMLKYAQRAQSAK